MTNARIITDVEALLTGRGAFPYDWQPLEARLKNAGTAATAGKVYMLDYATVASNGGYTQVIDPATAGLKAGIFCVAMETIAANATGTFRFVGDVPAFVDTTATNAAAGTFLAAIDASNNLTSTVTALKVIAVSKAAGTNANVRCYFNGFGLSGASMA